jgi:hypothetical protein
VQECSKQTIHHRKKKRIENLCRKREIQATTMIKESKVKTKAEEKK